MNYRNNVYFRTKAYTRGSSINTRLFQHFTTFEILRVRWQNLGALLCLTITALITKIIFSLQVEIEPTTVKQKIIQLIII